MKDNLYYDRSPLTDFNELVQSCKPDLESPTRSTVPLLAMVKEGHVLFERILPELQLGMDSKVHFEFKVKPPRGNGKESHTDMMVLSGDTAVAFEVKWTEPRYSSVEKWMQEGEKPENRREVLQGWLDLLQQHATRTLTRDDFSEAIYQSIHRAASACATAVHPQMIYINFTPLPNGCKSDLEEYRKDLAHLHGLLGSPHDFPFYQIEVQMEFSEAFERIKDLPKKSSETAEVVQAALCDDSLFKFVKYDIHKIGS